MHEKQQSLLGAYAWYDDTQNDAQPLIKYGINLVRYKSLSGKMQRKRTVTRADFPSFRAASFPSSLLLGIGRAERVRYAAVNTYKMKPTLSPRCTRGRLAAYACASCFTRWPGSERRGFEMIDILTLFGS